MCNTADQHDDVSNRTELNTMDPEAIAKELQAGLAELKALLALNQTKAAANEVTAQKHDEKIAHLQDGIENLKTAMVALQATKNRPDLGAGEGLKTLGALLTESAQYKHMVDNHLAKCESVHLGTGFGQMMRRKDLTSTTGPNVQAYQMPAISPVRFEMPRIRDIINVFQTTSSSVDFVKETRWNQLSTTLTAQATAAQADLEVANITAFYAGQEITIDPDGVGTTEAGTVLSVTDPVQGDATGTITLTAVLANTHAAGIEIVSDTFVFTPETILKPTANAKFELGQAPVKTLAHWIPCSRQILDDAAGLRAHVDQRLLEGLALAEEKQVLYGDGTANQLQGIISDPDTQTYSWSAGVSGDARIDAIRRGMTLAALAHYPVDAIIMHPTDWEHVQLTKGSDGHYIFGGAPATPAPPTVWGVPVVVTTQINVGTCLLGAFRLGVAMWDRMQSTIRIAEQHANFFIENMVAILAEERIALTLIRPESFVAVTFDSAP